MGRIALEAQTVKAEDQILVDLEEDVSMSSQDHVTWDEELPEVKMEIEKPLKKDDRPPQMKSDKKEPVETPQRSRQSSRIKNILKNPPKPREVIPDKGELLRLQRAEERKIQKQQLITKRREEAQERRLNTEKRREEAKVLVSMMTEMNLLNCKECLIEFDSLEQLQKHTKIVHKTSRYSIFCCGRNFLFRIPPGKLVGQSHEKLPLRSRSTTLHLREMWQSTPVRVKPKGSYDDCARGQGES